MLNFAPLQLNKSRGVLLSLLALPIALVLLLFLILRESDWSNALLPTTTYFSARGSEPTTLLNYTKVATMLEPRMSATLIPLLVLNLAIIPRDWPVVIWCSMDNYAQLASSHAISSEMETGRLNLTILPPEVDIHNGEYLSRFLTKPWFYHQFHPEAEWMFFFQSDATLCAASEQSLDDWLGYEWVGSPTLWTPNTGHGGNGGLGIRRISTMQQVTSDSSYVREDWHGDTDGGPQHENAEDYWFMTAIDRSLGERGRWPEQDGRDQNEFSAVMNSEVLRPLGVHKGHGSMGLFANTDIHEDSDASMKRLLHYCPELSLVLDEDIARFNG